MELPKIKNIKYFLIPIVLIVILAICETYPLYGRFAYPLSWDIWYHMRIVENLSNGYFIFDPVSFGPEGRIHTYPPLFHILLVGLYKIINLRGLSIMDAARIMPAILFPLSAISTFLLICAGAFFFARGDREMSRILFIGGLISMSALIIWSIVFVKRNA